MDDILAPAQNLLKDNPVDLLDDNMEDKNDKETAKKQRSKLSRKHVTRSVKKFRFSKWILLKIVC